MTMADLRPLLPILVLAGAVVVTMLVIAFYRHHRLTAVLALTGLAGAFVTLPVAGASGITQVTSLLVIDRYALFYMGLTFAGAFAVGVLSYGYQRRQAGYHEEFYLLLLLATLGSAVLVSSNHFASFFLGLEILSVSLYGLISYQRSRARDIEAGVKYLILAAASSSFLLFGMALVYASQGTMAFDRLMKGQVAAGLDSALVAGGLGLLAVGIGYKLAVVPFHMWTPDVYEGAPAPVTGFIATVSKGAVFALLLRLFTELGARQSGPFFVAFSAIAIASMFAGNLLALMQTKVKRVLAYSSIAHLGYLTTAFLASGALAVTAVAYYLVAYFATTLAAFGVIGVLSGEERDADDIEDFQGLFWRRPWLAAVFTVALLSLAGIPLTAGFVGKFYVLSAGVGSALWALVISLVVSSGIGLYYYLRIIVAMYLTAPEGGARSRSPVPTVSGSVTLAILFLLLIWFGVYPTPLIRLIESTVGGLI